jgi:hypothetical protein
VVARSVRVLGRIEGRHLADATEFDEVLLASRRDAVDHDVLDARQGGCRGISCFASSVLRLLGPLGELLGLRDERALLLLGRLRDLLAERVLLGAQLFEGGQRCPARSVGLDRRVAGGRIVSARDLRAADDVGVVAKKSEVDHSSSLWREADAAARAPVAGGLRVWP